jgi:predicted RNase H-like HicB family nuclease
MKYRVTLVESDEGFAVWCDDLPGCNSQGATREEALQNIRDAISEYLAAQPEIEERFGVIRQSSHIIMSNGIRTLTIPRHNPINAYTMGNIAKQAGFTPDEFRKLL